VQAIDERVAVPESRVGRAGVISGGLHGPFDRAPKRAMDVLIATLGLVFLSPLILSIAALVKLIDGGEVFYGQVRVGANGAPFRCFKFRTGDECVAVACLETVTDHTAFRNLPMLLLLLELLPFSKAIDNAQVLVQPGTSPRTAIHKPRIVGRLAPRESQPATGRSL
jgi:hypothetical protein